MDELQRFYDCFAKGKTKNGWMDTPRLRLSLRATRRRLLPLTPYINETVKSRRIE